MKNKTQTLVAKDGTNLFYQQWEPEGDTRAVVCLVHGLGEHSSRYHHVAEFLCSKGFALQAIDLRGHGKSGGKRGYFKDFDDLLQDVSLLIQTAKRQYPDLPIFLYGHSMGGIIVLNYPLQMPNDLQGVVATDPGLRTALENQKAKLFLSKVFAAIWPTMGMATGLAAEDISRDPLVVQKYQKDELVHDRGTPALAVNLFKAIQYGYDHASEFTPPLLIMHGTADKIAFVEGSQEFAAKVKGDCTLKLWPGLAHEIHNEPEKEQVLSYLTDWLESKL